MPISPNPTATTHAAGVSIAPAPSQTPTGSLPPLERFVSHYERYNGPIGRAGANKTTHTAEVRFPSGRGLAVVKAFALRDKGWVNEAVAWSLGRALGIPVPPKAMLLAAHPSELSGASEPELHLAFKQWGGHGPIVLWCASRLDVKPPQQVWHANWEMVVVRREGGQRLAAFDAWIGNCDRIAENAPYWMTKGQIVAIDHERLAFAQDWFSTPPSHLDEQDVASTHLLSRVLKAVLKGTVKQAEGKHLVAALSKFSKQHGDELAKLHAEVEQFVASNVTSNAASNLLQFLTVRATDAFIQKRLGTSI